MAESFTAVLEPGAREVARKPITVMARHFGETSWFAIQAKPCRERAASARLRSLGGVEVFFPERTAGGPRPGVRPLFPGYLFARFCPLRSLDLVRYASGVLRVVGNQISPIPVAQDIIDSIRALVEEDGYIRLAPRA